MNSTIASPTVCQDAIRYSVTVSRQGFKTTKSFNNQKNADDFCDMHIQKGNKILKKIRWNKK